MSPTGFEPTIPASERLQTHTLDREATWIDINKFTIDKIFSDHLQLSGYETFSIALCAL